MSDLSSVRRAALSRLSFWLGLLAGLVAWLAAVAGLQPGLLAAEWAAVLLLFAPLVIVPLTLPLLGPLSWPGRAAGGLQFPAAFVLILAFLQPAGLAAGLYTVPWLLVTALLCLEGLLRIWRGGGALTEWCLDAGLVFLLVGGLWTSAARAGLRPLDFDAAIVLLTANHFHYAGFVLPILAGLAGRRLPGPAARWTAAGVLAGVPLVALGITTTQLGFAPWPEVLAALVMAASGLGVALLHLRLARQAGEGRVVRLLWGLAGGSLVCGMALAGLYAVRFYGPLGWLSIEWMRALHGTINVFGFSLAGVAACRLAGPAAAKTQ